MFNFRLSGSVVDPFHFDTDPDPDPRIRFRWLRIRIRIRRSGSDNYGSGSRSWPNLDKKSKFRNFLAFFGRTISEKFDSWTRIRIVWNESIKKLRNFETLIFCQDSARIRIRIRIRNHRKRFRGSGSRSKWNGSATLVLSIFTYGPGSGVLEICKSIGIRIRNTVSITVYCLV